MPETSLCDTRKRPHLEWLTPQHNEPLPPTSKKQKRNHSGGLHFQQSFWNNLSRIDLTRSALEELDRRNVRKPLDFRQPYLRGHRPITRGLSKKLEQIAETGSLDLSDLRGFPEPLRPQNPAMSLRSSSRSARQKSMSIPRNESSTNTSKSTGPYNRNFQQHLVDNGIYPDEYEYPDGRVPPQPDNMEDIKRRLLRPRPSLSPSRFSDKEFKRFRRTDTHALKEKQVTTAVIPIIEGDVGDSKCISGGIQFNNLEYLTSGVIVPGNPDIYYGARPESLNRRVRDKLSGQIIPSTQHDLPIVPNFLMAVKGPDGSLAVAGRQASYDGALGARSIHSLQSYGQATPIFDNKAYTITSIYHGGQLKIFTSHPGQGSGPKGRQEYFMHQLKGWSMTSDLETFRQGATAYRNARDWAKEQRETAIEQANERAQEREAQVSSAYTSEPARNERLSLSQDSSDPGNDTSQTSTDLLASGAAKEPVSQAPKRLNRQSLQSSPPQRKRHNAGISNTDFLLSEPEVSEYPGLSQSFEIQALEQESGVQAVISEKSKITEKANSE